MDFRDLIRGKPILHNTKIYNDLRYTVIIILKDRNTLYKLTYKKVHKQN